MPEQHRTPRKRALLGLTACLALGLSACSPDAETSAPSGRVASAPLQQRAPVEDQRAPDAQKLSPVKPGASIMQRFAIDEKQTARATVIGLGHNVAITPAGGLEVTPVPAKTVSGEPVEWDWSFTLGAPEVRGEQGWQALGAPEQVELAPDRLIHRWDGQTEAFFDHHDRGLEHSLSIPRAPRADGKIQVRMPIGGTLMAQASEDGQRVELFEGARAPKPLMVWQKLVVRDAKGRALKAAMRVEAGQLVYDVDAQDAAYPVLIDPLLTTPVFTVSGQVDNERLGTNALIVESLNNDDFDDLVVGQAFYSDTLATRGRVLVFASGATGINPVAAAAIVGDQASEQFGLVVTPGGDINGDGAGEFMAAGPRYNGAAGSLTGRVVVFFGSNLTGINNIGSRTWSYEGNAASLRIGSSMASGDFDGDGFTDVAIGTPYASSNTGMAMVFYGGAPLLPLDFSTLGNTPDWTYTNPTTGEFFGFAMARGEGFTTASCATCDSLIVGTQNGNGSRGRVDVFYGRSTTFDAAPAKSAPDWSFIGDQIGGRIGQSLGGRSDLNGDGRGDLVAGSITYTGPNGATNTGIVRVFYGKADGTGIETTPGFTVIGPQPGSRQGTAIGTGGDLNNDGIEDLVISARSFSTSTNTEAGAVFVHLGQLGGLAETPYITLTGDQDSSRFGAYVSIGGDVNNDGFSDMATSAFQQTVAGVNRAGQAYVFLGTATCDINGVSYAAGERNPTNTCEFCDPNISRTAFQANTDGRACDDGDLCTENGTCDASGACVETPVTCDDGNDCTIDSCDAALGCQVDAASADGQACSGDGLGCTTDVCAAGSCGSTIDAGSCVINNTCFADGDPNPANPCEVCDTATSTSAWSPATAGTTCSTGQFCVVNEACDGAGACVGAARDCSGAADECNTGGACDEANDTCTPAMPVVDGTVCTDPIGLACTQGQCIAGACSGVVTMGCAIGGTCFADGDANPTNPCEVCDASVSTTAWSPASAATVCVAAGCATDGTGRFQPESLCDGAGACNAIPLESCGLFACGAGGCLTQCADASQCVGGAMCIANGCTADNLAPIADAGADQTVTTGVTVTLDGSSSSDPNGDALTYQWAFVSSSTGTVVTLNNAGNVASTFVAPREAVGTEYIFQLTVSDGQSPALTATDEVKVTIGTVDNASPTADITGDATAAPGDTIELDGSGSSDTDGDPLTFAWSIDANGPETPAPAVTDQDRLSITFDANLATEITYTVRLKVTDPFGGEGEAAFDVTVTPEGDPDMGGDMGDPDMGGDMGDVDMGGDMGVTPDMGGGDMGAVDMGARDGDKLEGSGCDCSTAASPSKLPNDGALLGLALGLGAVIVRRRR